MKVKPKKLRSFTLTSFLIRLTATLFVVLSTYNPSGHSYVHWLASSWPRDWLLQGAAGIVYVVVYYLFFMTTIRSLHVTGIVLTTALLASLVWVMLDLGIVVLTGIGDFASIALYIFGTVLAIGMAWMPVYTLLSGQVSVDMLDSPRR